MNGIHIYFLNKTTYKKLTHYIVRRAAMTSEDYELHYVAYFNNDIKTLADKRCQCICHGTACLQLCESNKETLPLWVIPNSTQFSTRWLKPMLQHQPRKATMFATQDTSVDKYIAVHHFSSPWHFLSPTQRNIIAFETMEATPTRNIVHFKRKRKAGISTHKNAEENMHSSTSIEVLFPLTVGQQMSRSGKIFATTFSLLLKREPCLTIFSMLWMKGSYFRNWRCLMTKENSYSELGKYF